MTTNNVESAASQKELATAMTPSEASLARRAARAVAVAAVGAALLLGIAVTGIGPAAIEAVQEPSNTLAIVNAWPKKYCGCG